MTNEELILKAEEARKYSKCKYTKYSVKYCIYYLILLYNTFLF